MKVVEIVLKASLIRPRKNERKIFLVRRIWYLLES